MARTVDVKREASGLSVSPAWVRRVALGTLAAEKIADFTLGILLTGDRQIRTLNRRHLKHDTATDVISFLLEPGVGDVVVSVDFARRYALKLGLDPKEEIARYVVHGILHLAGYDDHDPEARAQMFARQEMILKKIRPHA